MGGSPSPICFVGDKDTDLRTIFEYITGQFVETIFDKSKNVKNIKESDNDPDRHLLFATTLLMKSAILMVATDVVPSPSFQLSRIWPPIPYKVTMKSISIHIIYIIFGKSLIFCCWKYLTCSRCNSKPIVKRVNAQNSKVSISTSVEEELESKLNSLQRGIFHSFEAFESKNLKKDFKSLQWIFSHPEVDSFKTDPPSPFFA